MRICPFKLANPNYTDNDGRECIAEECTLWVWEDGENGYCTLENLDLIYDALNAKIIIRKKK